MRYGRIKERALVTVNAIYTLLHALANPFARPARMANGEVLGLPFLKGKVFLERRKEHGSTFC